MAGMAGCVLQQTGIYARKVSTGASVDNHGWYGWMCSAANWYICQKGKYFVVLIHFAKYKHSSLYYLNLEIPVRC